MNECTGICPLCGRQLARPCNRHHLLPLSKGGRGTETVMMHKVCHDKIHAVFTEMELKRFYNTINSLQANEEIARFIKWIRKKEPEYYDKSVRQKNEKRLVNTHQPFHLDALKSEKYIVRKNKN